MEVISSFFFQRNVDQWPPARLKLLPPQKLTKQGVNYDLNNKDEEKRASESALLDTVARILRDELNQLEQLGPVSKADIVARFLQSAKVRPCF